jgi:hypothetical protein
MLYKDWATKKKFEEQQTTAEEIRDLLKLADEKLKDCEIISETSVSADSYHSNVYSAAIPCATVILRASGYRITKQTDGGHELLFQCLGFTIDPGDKYGTSLQEARLLRNRTSYESVASIKKEDVKKLFDIVRKLRADVQRWLEKHHSELL